MIIAIKKSFSLSRFQPLKFSSSESELKATRQSLALSSPRSISSSFPQTRCHYIRLSLKPILSRYFSKFSLSLPQAYPPPSLSLCFPPSLSNSLFVSPEHINSPSLSLSLPLRLSLSPSLSLSTPLCSAISSLGHAVNR